MATWDEFARSEPEFARLIQARFDSHKHKMLATLRKDGSPRISGIEATFADGQLWLGMMPGSLKALDLQRDPRLALHSAPLDSEMANGDAKISGRAIEHTDEATMTAFAGAVKDASGRTCLRACFSSSRSTFARSYSPAWRLITYGSTRGAKGGD